MRLSKRDKRPPSVTCFDDSHFADKLSRLVSEVFTGSDTSSSAFENFLYNKGWPGRHIFEIHNRPRFFVDLRTVPLAVLSNRFSVLLNSVYADMISSNLEVPAPTLARFDNATWPANDIETFVAKPPPQQLRNESEYRRYDEKLTAAIMGAVLRGLPFVPAATTATTVARTRVYECQWGWFATLLAAAGALFATGVAALALQLRYALPPDVLRYVSSMTVANAHFRTLPPGGTTLDGAQRARLLRDVRVRLGDIRGVDGDDDDDVDGGGGSDGADVGEIAFVAADDVSTRKLDVKRLYA
jgi:hypothetical protein